MARKYNRKHSFNFISAVIATLTLFTAAAAAQRQPLGFGKTASYYSGGSVTMAVAIADLNGDGKQDIVTVNQQGNNLGVLLGDGNGAFEGPVTYSSGGSAPTSVAVADLNGDGYPDLVVTNRCPITGECSNFQTSGNVSVLLGNGDGTFQTPIAYNTGGWDYTSQVAIADLNGDGHPDLIVSNDFTLGSWSGSVSVLLGKGDGTFRPAVNYDLGGNAASSVAAADLNGDGKPDLVVVGSGAVTVLMGNGDGTFQPPVSYGTGFAFANSDPGSVAVGDVNGDGKPDIVISDGNAGIFMGLPGAISVLLGNGDGTFQPPVTYDTGGLDATSVAIADVNGDGRPDIIATNVCHEAGVGLGWCSTLTGRVHVLLGNGDGTFGVPVDYGTGGFEASSVAVGDVNADGRPDLAIVNLYAYPYDGGTLDVRFNTFTVSTNTAITSSPNPSVVNQPVTLTATLSSSWPIPDGQQVVFQSGATLIGTGSTKAGVALLTTSSLSKGPHIVEAKYGGGGFLRAGWATATQVVNGHPSSTTLASSLNPSIYGRSVTFTATVTATGGTVPTGLVAFTWIGKTLGFGTLNSSGVATLTSSNLNANASPLTAVYRGDMTNQGSTSPALDQTVLQTTSSATITSSVNPSTAGQAVTFTAKITSPTVTAKGPVTFTLGKTILGTAQLSGGTAKFATSLLPSGSNALTAIYNGDSNIAGSSAVITQVVH